MLDEDMLLLQEFNNMPDSKKKRSEILDLDYAIVGDRIVFEDGCIYSQMEIVRLNKLKKNAGYDKIFKKLHLVKKRLDTVIAAVHQ